jgi:hypothetical protein
MVNVPFIKIKRLFPSERITTVDLRPHGDTVLYLVAPALECGVSWQVLRE